MNEVISGMRVIKMYGWEKPFGALVNEVRRYWRSYFRILYISPMFVQPILANVISQECVDGYLHVLCMYVHSGSRRNCSTFWRSKVEVTAVPY